MASQILPSNIWDIVFVELPDLDSEFEAGESIGVIESVKSSSRYAHSGIWDGDRC